MLLERKRHVLAATQSGPSLPFGGLVGTANLVSYWKLNETSGNRLDSVGTNHLTPSSAGTLPTSVAGKIGNSTKFVSTVSQSLQCNNNPTLQTGNIDFTFSLWFNLTAYNGSGGTFIGKDGGTRDYVIDNLSGGDTRFFVNGGGGGLLVHNITTITLGTWNFLVAWHDAAADTLNLQINNGAVASVGTGGGIPNATNVIFCLGNNEGGGASEDGLLDEVGFWKRVLTPAERTALYNSGNGLTF